MSNTLPNAAELILNPDGSIYHLKLLPEDIANTIIFVGDPDRVSKVSKHFDHIEVRKSKREFVTHTGTLNDKRFSVVSTGIGPDNIDIVWNELDALVNIDLNTGAPKAAHTQLRVFRLGTSGGLQSNVPTDSLLVSTSAIGLDSMMHFYNEYESDQELIRKFKSQVFGDSDFPVEPYTANAASELVGLFDDQFHKGITVTCNGFYAPQGRQLRLATRLKDLPEKLTQFNYRGNIISNFEMETAAIYGLGTLLGHQCCSVNAIIANRVDGTFSKDPYQLVDSMIQKSLALITKN